MYEQGWVRRSFKCKKSTYLSAADMKSYIEIRLILHLEVFVGCKCSQTKNSGEECAGYIYGRASYFNTEFSCDRLVGHEEEMDPSNHPVIAAVGAPAAQG